MTKKKVEEAPEGNPVVNNAIAAFQVITSTRNVFEAYASFGILLGKFAEFAGLMGRKQQEAQEHADKDKQQESEGSQPTEVDAGPNKTDVPTT